MKTGRMLLAAALVLAAMPVSSANAEMSPGKCSGRYSWLVSGACTFCEWGGACGQCQLGGCS